MCQNFRSLALTVWDLWCFEDLEEKDGGGDSLESVLKIRGGHFKVDIFSLFTSSKIGTNYVYLRPKQIYNHSGRAPTLLVHHLYRVALFSGPPPLI